MQASQVFLNFHERLHTLHSGKVRSGAGKVDGCSYTEQSMK